MKLKNSQNINSDFWQGTMSDIAFLLIIFFILTALFTIPHILRFTVNRESSIMVKEKDLITVTITEDGIWYLNKRITTREELLKSASGDKFYRINVHDERPYQDFVDVLDVFHTANIYQLEVVTDE